jgi:hypothetical protein
VLFARLHGRTHSSESWNPVTSGACARAKGAGCQLSLA